MPFVGLFFCLNVCTNVSPYPPFSFFFSFGEWFSWHIYDIFTRNWCRGRFYSPLSQKIWKGDPAARAFLAAFSMCHTVSTPFCAGPPWCHSHLVSIKSRIFWCAHTKGDMGPLPHFEDMSSKSAKIGFFGIFTVVSWVELSWVFFCDQRLDSRPQIYSVPSVAPPPHFHLESDWVSFADPSLAAQLAGRNGLEGRPKTMHFLQCFPVLWWTTSRQIEAKPQSRILEKWMAPILHMFFFAIVAFVWGFWIFLQFSCSFLRYFFFWKSLKSTVFFLQLSFGETELVGFKVLCV